MTQKRRGIPFVVAAPSGTGKTSICRRVLAEDPQVVFSVSHTTRSRRDDELDSRDYHFVSEPEFERLTAEGAFLEWAIYNGHHYGTSAEALERALAEGRDVLLEIEVQGARQVRERRSDARLVFLLPPSFAELETRLQGRGTDSREEIARRLEWARRELSALRDFDYAVVNDDLECCVGEVLTIIRTERAGNPEALRRRLDPAAAEGRLRASG